MDLESEFQKLMDEAIKTVEEKRAQGEYSREEAADLTDLIHERRYAKRAWNSSGCSFDEPDYDYDDAAWNRSGLSC